MANSPYVFDASADNFARLVLENSAKGKVYHHGRVVDTLHGAEPEGALRDFIRKQLADTASAVRLAAETANAPSLARGPRLDPIAEAALADPENTRIPLDLAKLLAGMH